MAGDWIKFRTSLPRHPKVVRMARALGAHVREILGACAIVWSIADEQTENGKLDGYTLADLDNASGLVGFGQAMADVEWASENAEGVVLIEFRNQNGSTAKRRAVDAKRAALKRDRVQRNRSEKRHDATVTKLGPREEKRREEKHMPPNPPRGGRRVVEVSPGFAAFWAAWPSHKRKADRERCVAKWAALGLEPQTDAIVAKVKAWAASEDWTKDGGQYTPAPLVWLNRGSYTAPAPGETPENARAAWLKSLTDQQRAEMVAEFRAVEKSLPRGTTFGEWAWNKYGPGGAD